MAALRRRVDLEPILVDPLGLFLAYFDGARDLLLRYRNQLHLAIFGGPERDLVVLEIGRKLFRGRRRNLANLAAVERHVLDAALLVAIAVGHLGRDLRGRQPGTDRLCDLAAQRGDRKSTRLNSSHLVISYAVFCLKKKKKTKVRPLFDKKKKKTQQ